MNTEQPLVQKTIPSYYYFLNIPVLIGAIAIGVLNGVGLIFVMITPGLGYLAGWLYSKRKPQTTDALEKFVAWLNVVSWVIPIFGFATSFASLAFIPNVNTTDKRRFIILTYVGLYFTLANAILGELAILRHW